MGGHEADQGAALAHGSHHRPAAATLVRVTAGRPGDARLVLGPRGADADSHYAAYAALILVLGSAFKRMSSAV
jgi:hypothetical protein